MDENLKKRIVAAVKNSLSDRFRVIDNTKTGKKIFNGFFPEIILMQLEPPKNDDIVFLMKFESDVNIDKISEWKDYGDSPIPLYLVVPEEKIDQAKKIADALDSNIRFATYSVNHADKVNINYE